MTTKMFTRQDAAMAASSANIPQEHAEKMIQMALGKYVTPCTLKLKLEKKLSPQAITRRQEFLSETLEPLYSVDQVQTLLTGRGLVGEHKQAGDRPPAPSASPSGLGRAHMTPVATDSPAMSTVNADADPVYIQY